MAILNGVEWGNVLMQVQNDIIQALPYVSGQLRSSVNLYIGMSNSNSMQVLGEIKIEAPYATYVNYGYEKHPNSAKLARDYMIVETTTKNAIRSILQAKGVRVE